MIGSERRLDEIHSMLVAGHRSARLERHSVLLLAGVGALVIGASELVITDTRFPELQQRALALLAWLAAWLGGAALLERRLTERAYRRRGETMPFVQLQVMRATWMLVASGVLGSIAMFFYGGGTMVYGLWIVLLGLGTYFFGLFARPLIEWIGLMTIAIGVAALAAGVPYGITHWVAASAFGIGIPLAGWLDGRPGDDRWPRRAASLAVWTAAVLAPPCLLAATVRVEPPAAPVIESFEAIGAGEQVLRLAAGTRVPLRLDLEGDVLAVPPDAALEMTLNAPVEIALRDGVPDGRYRIGDGRWHVVREGVMKLTIDRLMPGITRQGAEVRVHGALHTAEPVRAPR